MRDNSPSQGPANPLQRILVIDDNTIIRKVNTRVLVRSGYKVDAAEDGAAGWEALRSNNFDLLITDHEMPKLSGLELVKKVRSARMTLPVILATGRLPQEELNLHPWLQIAATLLKPFSPRQLLETVTAVLCPAKGAGFGSDLISNLRTGLRGMPDGAGLSSVRISGVGSEWR